MIVLITATIESSERKAAFHEAIKKHSSLWWHYIDKTWLVKTTHTPSEWISWLRPVINETDDSIFVTKIDPDSYGGWLPQKAFDWIKNNRD